MDKKEVVVVVPVYRPELTVWERASLRQTVGVLQENYPVELLVPCGMDCSAIRREFSGLPVREVSDEWLGRKNGIAGYNRMMLSAGFYELFHDYEYLPILKQYLRWRLRRAERAGRMIRQSLYGKIGNGGLSLRRVESFRAACEKYGDEIERFCSMGNHLGNEDVFWAVVPEGFRYPSQEEALRFAFDTNPRYCYRLCGSRLPMGCHSWSKPRMWRFWQQIIPPPDAASGAAADK